MKSLLLLTSDIFRTLWDTIILGKNETTQLR